jgi:hypothetical protein
MKSQRVRALVLTALVLLGLAGVFSLSLQMPMPVSGAPLAAPTPITQYAGNNAPKLLPFWSASSLTADGRSSCFNVGGYNTLDVHYILDQGTTNTTTVNLQFTNVKNSYITGAAMVTSNAADASDMKQFNVFGDRVCLYADVTNSNALSLTAVGLVK